MEQGSNGLIAHVGSDYGGVQQQRLVDQVIINHGTRPLDELYFELKAGRPEPRRTGLRRPADRPNRKRTATG